MGRAWGVLVLLTCSLYLAAALLPGSLPLRHDKIAQDACSTATGFAGEFFSVGVQRGVSSLNLTEIERSAEERVLKTQETLGAESWASSFFPSPLAGSIGCELRGGSVEAEEIREAEGPEEDPGKAKSVAAKLKAAEKALAAERARATAISQEMGQLKEEFLEAEADLTEARKKLRETEMQSFKKAREGFEEELSKTKMELAATEHLLANYQKEAVTFDTGMQTMERQIDEEVFARVSAEQSLKEQTLAMERLEEAHRRKGEALKQTLEWMEKRHQDISAKVVAATEDVVGLKQMQGKAAGAEAVEAKLAEERARREKEAARASKAEKERDEALEKIEEERWVRLCAERGLEDEKQGRKKACSDAEQKGMQLAKLREEIEAMNLQFERRLAGHKAKDGMVMTLEDAVRREAAKGQHLASMLSAATQQMTALQEEIKQEMSRLEGESKSNSQGEIAEMRKELDAARKREEKSRAELEKKKAEKAGIEKELVERSQGLEKANKALLDAEQALEKERGEATRTKRLLEEGEAELAAKQGDIAKLEWEIGGLRGDAAKASEEKQANKERAKEEAKRVDKDMAFLRSEGERRKKEAEETQKLLEEAEDKLKVERAALKKLEEERNALKARLGESQQALTSTSQERDELKGQISVLGGQVEELRRTCEAVKAQAQEWEAVADKRAAEIKALGSELSKAHEDSKQSLADYVKRADVAELEVAQLEAKLKVAFELSDRSTEEFQQRLAASNATMRSLNETVVRLRMEQARTSEHHRRVQMMRQEEISRMAAAKKQHTRWAECATQEALQAAREAELVAEEATEKLAHAEEMMGELLDGVDRAIGMQNASSKRTQELEAKLIELEQMLSAASENAQASSERSAELEVALQEAQDKQVGEIKQELDRSRAKATEDDALVAELRQEISDLKGKLDAALKQKGSGGAKDADVAKERKKREEVESKLAEREKEFKGKLAEKEGEFKGKLAEKEGEFKGKLAERETEFKGKLAEKEGEFKGKLAEKEKEFKGKLEAASKKNKASKDAELAEKERLAREEAEGRLAERERELKDVNDELVSSKDRMSSLASSLEGAERELASLRAELQAKDKQGEDMSRILERESQVKSERDELLSSLGQSQEQLADLRSEKDALESSLRAEIHEEQLRREHAIRNREEIESSLRREIQEEQLRRDQVVRDKDELESSLRHQIDQHQAWCDQVERDRDELVASLRNEISIKQQHHADAISVLRSTEDQVLEERQRREGEGIRRKEAEAAIKASKQQREEAERQLEIAREELRKQVERTEEEVKHARQEIDSIVLVRERQRDAERIRAEQAEEKLRELEGRFEEEQRQRCEAVKQAGRLVNECQSFKSEVASLASRLEQARAGENKALEERIRKESAEDIEDRLNEAREGAQGDWEEANMMVGEMEAELAREIELRIVAERRLNETNDDSMRLTEEARAWQNEAQSLRQKLTESVQQTHSAEKKVLGLRMLLDQIRGTKFSTLPSVVTWHAPPPQFSMTGTEWGLEALNGSGEHEQGSQAKSQRGGLFKKSKEFLTGAMSLGIAASGIILQGRGVSSGEITNELGLSRAREARAREMQSNNNGNGQGQGGKDPWGRAREFMK